MVKYEYERTQVNQFADACTYMYDHEYVGAPALKEGRREREKERERERERERQRERERESKTDADRGESRERQRY